MKEAGLEGLDLDADLAELINNQVDLNEEDEEKAYNRFFKDLMREDKENIKKVLEGAYRAGRKRKAMYDEDGDEDEMNRRRIKRLEELIVAEGDNDDDLDENGDLIGGIGKSDKKTKYLREE